MKKVYIDVTKGGYLPGAVNNGLIEKDLNLNYSLIIKSKLETLGYEVHISRSTDKFIPLDDVIDHAIEVEADCLVSLSFAYTSDTDIRGFTTYRHTRRNKNTESYMFQEIVHNKLASLYTTRGSIDRGICQADYLVLRKFPKHAVHLELGVLSSEVDASIHKSTSFTSTLLNQITNSIDEFFTSCLCEITNE